MARITEAPYNAQQNKLCHHERDGWYYDANGVKRPTEWRPVVPVTGTFRYDGYGRGQSAAYFWWLDTATGTRYPMFMTDMDDLLKGAFLQSMGGATYFVATITISKRGQNYGVKLVNP
jgi:hypothetical protein